MYNQRKGTIMSDFSCRNTVVVGASNRAFRARER